MSKVAVPPGYTLFKTTTFPDGPRNEVFLNEREHKQLCVTTVPGGDQFVVGPVPCAERAAIGEWQFGDKPDQGVRLKNDRGEEVCSTALHVELEPLGAAIALKVRDMDRGIADEVSLYPPGYLEEGKPPTSPGGVYQTKSYGLPLRPNDFPEPGRISGAQIELSPSGDVKKLIVRVEDDTFTFAK